LAPEREGFKKMSTTVRKEYSIHFYGFEQPGGGYKYHSTIQPALAPGQQFRKTYKDAKHLAATLKPFLRDDANIEIALHDYAHTLSGWQKLLELTDDEATLFRE
jgi:hypothetical protein